MGGFFYAFNSGLISHHILGSTNDRGACDALSPHTLAVTLRGGLRFNQNKTRPAPPAH